MASRRVAARADPARGDGETSVVKAWVVHNEFDGEALMVNADTRGQARDSAIGEWGMSFHESFSHCRVLRVPELDDKRITDLEALRVGAYSWFECLSCDKHITFEDGRFLINGEVDAVIVGERAFCSADCRDKFAERRGLAVPA